MKRSSTLAAAIALALVAAGASTARAQVARPVSFGVSAGAVIPTGDLGDLQRSGYIVSGIAEMRPAVTPIGARFDLSYVGLTGRDIDLFGRTPDLGLVSANLNAVVNLGAGAMTSVRPYLLGGAGLYNYKVTEFVDGGDLVTTNTSRETKFGLNGGAGLRFDLSGFSTFVEARFHNVFVADQNLQFVPISFGVMF